MFDERTVDRFWQKVEADPETGCWLWTAYKKPTGYGQFGAGDKVMYAHRFAWELENGPIPAGLELDHICRVRHCVNPAHLDPVDHRTNILRGVNANAAKTECLRGHPFNEANTYVPSNGSRHCRECERFRMRERYRRSVSASSGGVRDR